MIDLLIGAAALLLGSVAAVVMMFVVLTLLFCIPVIIDFWQSFK